ncbi:MAG: hypothetical protein AAB554_02655 [Patescibacteria group bacterium]
MSVPDLKEAARKVRLVVTDVDGVHTSDLVTIYGKPDADRKLVFGLHVGGKAARLMPCDEAGAEVMHYLASAEDGRIEGYQFFTGDGIAVKECRRNGIPVVMVTGRNSPAIRQRASDLGVECRTGVSDKVGEVGRIVASLGIAWDETLFIGNDVQDLALLRLAGFSAAPSDAVQEVRDEVMYVSVKKGGEGAVRDILQRLLEFKGLWQEIVKRERTLG